MTNFKIFFSRTTGPISTKLGINYPWVKRIEINSNQGLCPFPRGNNYKIEIIHWQIWKIFFSRTTRPIQSNLAQIILGWLGFKLVQMKGSALFQEEIITKLQKYIDNLRRSSSPEPTKLSTNHPWMKRIRVFKWRTFFKGRKLRNNENILMILKNLLLQNHWANSIKFGAYHPWVKSILDYSNEGPVLFSLGDEYKIVKMHWQNFRIFDRTMGPISTKLSKKHPLVKRIWVCSNGKATPFYIGR